MDIQKIADLASSLWSFDHVPHINMATKTIEIYCDKSQVPPICDWLSNQQNYHFSGLIVEENSSWELCYFFIDTNETGLIKVITTSPLENYNFKSVSMSVHATDWHEREAEDLYGLNFENHPRLGDFILHDDVWQEGINPMRTSFNKKEVFSNQLPNKHWRPRKILNKPGSFIMPIGPVFSAEAESVNIQLETIGEEITRAFPRLFFKFRGTEKIAVGKSIEDTLLLAERNAGTSAFSHALAYCMAIEQLSDKKIPKRAKVLRIFFAEMERFRSHISTIEGICNSTGLIVAANQVTILEENMLRICCELSGHRYLFGITIPGGLSFNLNDEEFQDAVKKVKKILKELNEIEIFLINTSSFLDRLEEVGIITQIQAKNHGLVGPMARGSNYCTDLRKIQPYLGYENYEFETACEQEGDGYARLRVLFAETRQSVKILEQIVSDLPNGDIFSNANFRCGIGLAGVETPRGSTWHYVNIDENKKIKRYHLLTPSFTNWHGFHLAIENFAFQDLPIISATLGLSVAENDR